MDSFFSAVLGLGGIGLVFGVLISIADEKLKIEINQLETEILAALPGANCGGCGYAGCSGYAHHIASHKAPPDKCTAGGLNIAKKIGDLLGIEVKIGEKKSAYLKCQGSKSKASNIFRYDGFPDCQTAILVSGGHKACQYGCLGFGTCVRVCRFNAIKMNTLTKLPEIDNKLCTACGVCVTECPKKIIALINQKNEVEIRCSSYDKGVEVKKKCSIGCIACQICVKKCPEQAITMEDNLAVIDYAKCNNCLQCVFVCPTKTIYSNSI